jgi:hypothetical protein
LIVTYLLNRLAHVVPCLTYTRKAAILMEVFCLSPHLNRKMPGQYPNSLQQLPLQSFQITVNYVTVMASHLALYAVHIVSVNNLEGYPVQIHNFLVCVEVSL